MIDNTLTDLDFLIGLKLKKLVKGSLNDTWQIVNGKGESLFLDRRSIEFTNNGKEFDRIKEYGILVGYYDNQDIIRFFGGKDIDAINRFKRLNSLRWV